MYIVRLMEHDSWLLDFNCLPNKLLCYCFVARPIGVDGWCEKDGRRELVA